MKVSGESQAVLLRVGLVVAGVALAAWVIRRQAGAAWDAGADAFNGLVDSIAAGVDTVLALPGQALDAVWKPENAVSATAGQNAGLPDWSSRRDISPLIAYFDAHGNTAGNRASAKAAGWTDGEISQAVATLGTLNGYY